MKNLIIQPQDDKKGRSFQSANLATITADKLYPEGQSETIRPVWAMFAGSDAELRPFMANLRLGRKAQEHSYSRKGNGERMEFLKSIKYQIAWQREPGGVIASIFHPSLFRLDPGMVDPQEISFVMLVPKHWAAKQTISEDKIQASTEYLKSLGCPLEEKALRLLVPTSYLFAAYLDRRTRCPLIANGNFYLQLLCGALERKLASFPGTNIRYGRSSYSEWGHNPGHLFNAEGLDDVGIQHAISFKASHEEFETFLAEHVAAYFKRESFESITSFANQLFTEGVA